MGARLLSPVLRTAEVRLPPQARWTKRVAFGARIRNARVAAGMTQTELAAGITSTAYLSRIEANERRPSRALLVELVGRLGLSADDLVGGESQAHEGLRCELAHADLLLGSGHHEEAARVAEDLAEVAAGIGVEDVAHAAELVRAAALTAVGSSRTALKIALPLTEGPMGLPAMVAVARAYLELRQFRRAIDVGQRIWLRLAASDPLSAREGTEVALIVCDAYRALGRDSAAVRVARLALKHLPADVCAQVAAGDEPLFEPADVSYQSFGHVVRHTERAVAALDFDRMCASIDELRDHTSASACERSERSIRGE